MANMTFGANLLPKTSAGYSLGSTDLKWNIYGTLYGNADTATKDSDGNIINSTYLKLSGGSMTGNITTETAGMSIHHINGIAASSIGDSYYNAAIEIRENELVGTSQSDILYAPTLGFHWAGRVASALMLNSSNILCLYNNSGNLGEFETGTIYLGGTSSYINSSQYTGSAQHLLINGATWNSNWNWSGQGGQPNWLWGSNDGTNMYVWNPSNFNVNYATYANHLGSLGTNVMPESGRTSDRGGVYTYNTYSSDAMPSTNYWSTIGFGAGTSGHCEITANWCSNSILYFRTLRDCCDNWYSWNRIWVAGNSVTGAVWNDYAEYRQSDITDFGYVMIEKGDDTLEKSTERLQSFAGITSDTWGFSQGETDKAKTPIAVAGRVLVYTYQDRNNYKPGDCVCSAPGGTVDIMTREEVREYPDRIVGTVSCVPDYKEWGGGENADRPPVKVNDRIWIKVR